MSGSNPLHRTLGVTPGVGALDPNALGALRRQARGGNADLQVAREFESLLGTLLLKSMRATLPGGDPLSSPATQLATSLFDQQVAAGVAGRSLGLAEMIARQMQRGSGNAGAAGPSPSPGTASAVQPALRRAADSLDVRSMIAMLRARSTEAALRPGPAQAAPMQAQGKAMAGPVAAFAASATAGPSATTGESATAAAVPPASLQCAAAASDHDAASGAPSIPVRVAEFVGRFGRIAEEVAKVAGLPARAILGQAALETGWGRREIRNADGSSSYNVFGIKAGGNWQGKTVDVVTTEYVDGRPVKQVDRFRAYEGYREAFADYARLLAGSPRYRAVMDQAHDAQSFVQALGRSGYATDPRYGDKLAAILRQVGGGRS